MERLHFSWPLLLIISVCAAQEADVPSRLRSLVETERAFSRLSVQKGVREAFIAFFAEDGINFTPHPTNTREAMRKRSEQGPPITLSWEPFFADVSASDDLGYTTGPYLREDRSGGKTAQRHGYYFSVWKMQSDGNWRVVLDAGIQTQARDSAARPKFPKSPATARAATFADSDKAQSSLLEAERLFGDLAKAAGFRGAIRRFADPNMRLHRDGSYPVLGRSGIIRHVAGMRAEWRWEPVRAVVSRAGDLGYVYGKFEASPSGPQDRKASGYYVRMWKKDSRGIWRTVLDTTIPASDSN